MPTCHGSCGSEAVEGHSLCSGCFENWQRYHSRYHLGHKSKVACQLQLVGRFIVEVIGGLHDLASLSRGHQWLSCEGRDSRHAAHVSMLARKLKKLSGNHRNRKPSDASIDALAHAIGLRDGDDDTFFRGDSFDATVDADVGEERGGRPRWFAQLCEAWLRQVASRHT